MNSVNQGRAQVGGHLNRVILVGCAGETHFELVREPCSQTQDRPRIYDDPQNLVRHGKIGVRRLNFEVEQAVRGRRAGDEAAGIERKARRRIGRTKRQCPGVRRLAAGRTELDAVGRADVAVGQRNVRYYERWSDGGLTIVSGKASSSAVPDAASVTTTSK